VKVGFFGTGLIARYLHEYLGALGVVFAQVGIHDLVPEYARGFAREVVGTPADVEVRVFDSAADLIRSSELIVFATTAARPHVTERKWFDHNPLVLHLSLRDLSPELILSSTNIVDDVDHVLKADTSVHLAEQSTGNRHFIDGALCDVINGAVVAGSDRPVVFSPFGLGVLDLVVGDFVYRRAAETGQLTRVDDFFFDTDRYRSPAKEPARNPAMGGRLP
jgi:ornithine cyclodeaminase